MFNLLHLAKKHTERERHRKPEREKDNFSQRHPTLKWPQAGREEEEEVMDASKNREKVTSVHFSWTGLR